MKYKTIIFDLFGTLVPYVGEVEFTQSLYPLTKIFDVDLKVVQDFWSTSDGYYNAITEYTSTFERVKAFSEIIGIKESVKIEAAINSRLSIHADWLQPKRTTIETLKEIKAKNIKIGLISNCSAEVYELWETISISNYIDVPIFSCIEKMNKSEIDIFELCCSRLETSSKDIVYVGDSIGELLFAQKLGMNPVLMKTRKKVNWTGEALEKPLDVLKVITPSLACHANSKVTEYGLLRLS